MFWESLLLWAFISSLCGEHKNRWESILIFYFSVNQQCKGLRVEVGDQARVWLGGEGVITFLSARVPEGIDVMINMI